MGAEAAERYQAVEESPDLFLQKCREIAQSPDRRYRVLAGRTYKNLVLYDTETDRALLVQRELPFTQEQKVWFVDAHTFCVDGREIVDFYDARTGEHVEFLEMQFGYKQGQKVLLGFTYDPARRQFAALYVNEEPHKILNHKYWAVLFNRGGKQLDSFRTDIDLVTSWGSIVIPRLRLEGNELTVRSKKFTENYKLTFYAHTTSYLNEKTG